MTITFHPTHHRSTQPFNYQRLALVLVAFAAAALIAVAVQSTVSSTDAAPAKASVAVESVDQAVVAAFAETTGISGLSPASVGSVAADTAIRSTSTGETYSAQAIQLPPHVYDLTASSQSVTTTTTFVPFGAIPEVQAPSIGVPHRSNFASDTDWVSANGWD